MSRRIPLAALGLSAVAVTALIAGPATAQSGKTVTIRGGISLKPGVSVTDNQRFTPLAQTVAPNSTVTIRNRARTEDPHTFSIVRRTQKPRSAAAMERCFGPTGVCSQLFEAHEVPEGDGPPAKPLVDVGSEGFDQPGDSVVIMGKSPTRVKITARRGTNLHYLCGVHPNMQGTLRVR